VDDVEPVDAVTGCAVGPHNIPYCVVHILVLSRPSSGCIGALKVAFPGLFRGPRTCRTVGGEGATLQKVTTRARVSPCSAKSFQ